MEDDDVWIVYESEKSLEKYNNLHQMLWEIEFDPNKSVKSY